MKYVQICWRNLKYMRETYGYEHTHTMLSNSIVYYCLQELPESFFFVFSDIFSCGLFCLLHTEQLYT